MAVDTQYMRMQKMRSRHADDHYEYPEEIVRSFSHRNDSSRELAARGDSNRDMRYRDRDRDRGRDRDRDRDRDRRERRDDRRHDSDMSGRDRSRESPDRNGYTPLTSGTATVQEFKRSQSTMSLGDRPKKKKSAWYDERGVFDEEKWKELASCGELDIYTCLGLSNAFTITSDTQKIVFKILAVMVIQLMIPAMMLYMEFLKLESYVPIVPGQDLRGNVTSLVEQMTPARSGPAFRGIGFTMILYSLYSMYKNALDECRSAALTFCLTEGAVKGIWGPLMIGEFVNIVVSYILLIALYFIFINIHDGADLILNAVAVNFLGDVDGEFVDREAFQDALANFDELMETYKGNKPQAKKCWAACIESFLQCLLVLFLICGVCLAFVFLLVPSRTGEPWFKGD